VKLGHIRCVSEEKPDAPCIAISGNLSLRVPRGVAVLDVDLLTEQVRAWRQQPHIGPALVQFEPALSIAYRMLAPRSLTVKGALIFSMWMRPSCTGSMLAANRTS
jgi:hypothetical protein